MTVEPAPTKKKPWLWIAVGVVAVLCICVVIAGAAGFAFFFPLRSTVSEAEEPILVEATPEIAEPTVPAQGGENPLMEDAAPAGSAVEIGNSMTLTILDVTRPVDDLVANGNSFNTTAPEGEEYVQVDVEVTCAAGAGTPCTFYPTVMKIALPDGSTRDLQTFIEGVDDWDTSVEINAGETQQGFLLFIVPVSETDLVISYQDIYADAPLYLRLP